MEAKDLMIGDWVYRPDCYCKVKEVRENGIIGRDPLRGIISFKELEPIPLTPEILEKNGFKKDEKDEEMYYWNWKISDNCVSYDKETGMVRIFHVFGHLVFALPLSYVHQLQHALKLCGIDKEIEL